jgi:hypothetical protein
VDIIIFIQFCSLCRLLFLPLFLYLYLLILPLSLPLSLSLSLSLSFSLSLSLSLFLFICERSCAKYIIYFSVAIGEENFLSLASCYVRIFEKGLLFFG